MADKTVTVKRNSSWLESMFTGLTGLFTGFSHYLTGEGVSQDLTQRALANTFNAQQSRLDTAAAVTESERQRRQFIGGQRVALAKQGVAGGPLSSGQTAIEDADRAFAMDVLALKHRERLNQIEKAGETAMLNLNAKIARRVGRTRAIGSLLSSGAKFAEGYDIRIGE